jgi:hypothetical protein
VTKNEARRVADGTHAAWNFHGAGLHFCSAAWRSSNTQSYINRHYGARWPTRDYGV